MVSTYLVYLAFSIALTVWVGHTLHKNGRPFLLHAFDDNALTADSINNLLLVGFYLVNFGFVCLALRAEPVVGLGRDRAAVGEDRPSSAGARRHALLQHAHAAQARSPETVGERR